MMQFMLPSSASSGRLMLLSWSEHEASDVSLLRPISTILGSWLWLKRKVRG